MSGSEFRGSERFVIQRRLGAGGFGIVYEVLDRGNDATVALKTLRNVTPESLYRFKREFRSLADITHQNLVQLYELVCEGDDWFFTMELVRGRNFLQFVWGTERPSSSAASSAPDHTTYSNITEPSLMTVEIPRSAQTTERLFLHSPANLDRLTSATAQLVEGVAALHHSGNIHRDLKPSNVLVDEDGRVVVLDFGLVMDVGSEATLQSLQIAGTPPYMSPEQAAGLPLSVSSDWYSVGVMLYQSLTGELPFTGSFLQVLTAKQSSEPTPPGRVVSGVPDHLDALCRDLLRRDEASRPRSDEILERLQTPGWTAARTKVVRVRAPFISDSFVGRKALIEIMRSAFDEAKSGNRVTLCVEGPSGIGKSALVRHFLDLVRDEESSAVILTGRCYERESVPYKGVDTLMDMMARYLRRLPPANLEALLPRDIAALSQLFPVLRPIEQRGGPRRRVAGAMDSQELRRRAFVALRELIARMADRWPTVVVVDDLQWGDVDSADLLNEVLRGADAPSLLFIGAYRSDETTSSPFLRSFISQENKIALNMRYVAVDRLSAEEARQLAQSLLDSASPHFVEIAAAIAAEAGGSPFFIDELVRSAEIGTDLRAQTEHPIDTDARETSLAELIQLRLSRLPADARDILQLIAINVVPISVRLLKRAAFHEGFESALGILRTQHLVRTRETDRDVELESYHDRIRETVTRYLEPAVARNCHFRLANVLDQASEADAETVAEHYLAADEIQRGLDYVLKAAANAERALAFDRAARLYRRVLELGSQWGASLTAASGGGHDEGGQDARMQDHSIDLATINRRLGDALSSAGRGPEAAAAYLNVKGVSLDEILDMKRRAAQQLLFSGHIDEGLAVIQDVLSSIGMTLPPTKVATLLEFFKGRLRARIRGLRFQEREERSISPAELARIDACWSVSLGLGVVDTMRGAVFQTRHLLLALKSGELHRIARAVSIEAGYVSSGGSKARKRTSAMLRESSALATRAATPYARGLNQLVTGVAAYCQGRWRQGADLILASEQTLLDECTAMGVTWELDSSRFFSLCCQCFLGDIPTIRKRYPELVKEAEERGDVYAATIIRSWPAHFGELSADNPTAASENIRLCLDNWAQAGFHIPNMSSGVALQPGELWTIADIALYERRGSVAWAKVLKTWPILESSLLLHVQLTNVAMLDLRGRAAIAAALESRSATGRRDLLQAAISAARRIEKQKTSWGHALASLIRAGVLLAEGNQDEALPTLTSAEISLESLEMPLHAKVACWRRGALIGGTEGEALIASARTWMRDQRIEKPERLGWMLSPGLGEAI
jgi:serine/threonine protein kinase